MEIIEGFAKALPLDGLKDRARHVVVTRHDHLGDLVLSIPFFRILRQSMPQAEISVVVRPGYKDVLKDCPYIDNYYEHRYDNMHIHREMVAGLRRKGVDLALALASQSLDFKLCYQTHAPYRMGCVRVERFMRLFMSKLWLTHIVPVVYKKAAQRGVPIEHEVERTLHPLELLGCDCDDSHLELFLSEESKRYGEQLCTVWGKPVIAMHLHSRWLQEARDTEDTVWQVEDFLVLVGRLLDLTQGGRLLITYGPGERKIVEKCRASLLNSPKCKPYLLDGAKDLPEHIQERVVFVGNLPFQRWAAIYGQAEVVVSPDTSAVHVGAAMGKPVVGLWPPRDAIWSRQAFYPWQVPKSVITKGRPQPTIEKIGGDTQALLEGRSI